MDEKFNKELWNCSDDRVVRVWKWTCKFLRKIFILNFQKIEMRFFILTIHRILLQKQLWCILRLKLEMKMNLYTFMRVSAYFLLKEKMFEKNGGWDFDFSELRDRIRYKVFDWINFNKLGMKIHATRHDELSEPTIADVLLTFTTFI